MPEQPELATLLFLFIGVILIAKAITWLFKMPESPKKEMCSLHKWSINPATEKLQCQECNHVAGTINTEHGEY